MKRRDFVKKLGAGILAGGGFGGKTLMAAHSLERDRKKIYPASRVALMRDDKVRTKNGLEAHRVKLLLERSIQAATGAKDAVSGLGSLVGPDDVVGIKLNCLAGQPLSPTIELVQALTDVLIRCKVFEHNLVFFERSERDLVKGGFDVNRTAPGPRFLGHDSPDCGYEPRPWISGQVGSCLSRILTKKITVLINLGVLKDHNLSGLSAGMKNLFGIIHNPNKYHDSNCDPYVADVSAFDVVQKKLRLVVIDALTAQCEGGPAYRPEFAWQFNGILASTDPVAMDRVCLELVEAQRKKKGLRSLQEAKRYPRWLETASKMGLGESVYEKIKVVRGV